MGRALSSRGMPERPDGRRADSVPVHVPRERSRLQRVVLCFSFASVHVCVCRDHTYCLVRTFRVLVCFELIIEGNQVKIKCPVITIPSYRVKFQQLLIARLSAA